MTVIRPTNPQTDSPPSVTAPEVTEKSGFDHRRWALSWFGPTKKPHAFESVVAPVVDRPASTPAFTNHYRGMGVVGFANENARKHFNTLSGAVSYTHLRAHETRHDLVCRLLLDKKN